MFKKNTTNYQKKDRLSNIIYKIRYLYL